MNPETRINRPLPCLTCGYNLQGLEVSGRCPECGAGAADALRHLVCLDEATLRSLRRSSRLVALASVGVPCTYLALMLLSVLMRGLLFDSGGGALVMLIFGTFPVMGIVGWLGLTRPHLSERFGDPAYENARRRVRLFGLAFAAAAVLTLGAMLLGVFRSGSSAVPVVLAGLAACWTFRNRDGLKVVAWLGERAGLTRLRRSVRIFGWINHLALWLTLLSGLVLYPMMWSFGIPVERILGFPTALTAIAAVVLIGLTTAGMAGLSVVLNITIGRLLTLQKA